MNSYSVKFRHIMPVFLYVTIGTIAVLSLIRYFFAIEFPILDFKREVWQFWIPMAVPLIPITIWLRPKLRILIFKDSTDNRRFLFQIIAWIMTSVSSIVAQSYLTTGTGKLIEVSTVQELDQKEAAQYYRIKSFETLPSKGGAYASFRASGKYNQYLDIDLYYVSPIAKDRNDTRTIKEYKYWYGVSFHKQVSNRLSPAAKEREYETFAKACDLKMNHYAYHNLTYFERLPNTEDRDNYLQAVINATGTENNENISILEPSHEPFENRNGNKLAWIFGSYAIGVTIFLLLLLWPDISNLELQRQVAGKKQEEDDVVDMLKFLIPKKPHLVTSIILDLNILVFLIMIFTGVHILYPKGQELLEWGANIRSFTTSGDWWRLFTSMFVHAGVMHIIMNIYGLVLASMFIEPIIGAVRFAILYFVSGLMGSIASILWYENTISVGASGAIFGLVGGILAVTLTGIFAKESRRIVLLLFGPYVAISLIAGLAGGIDNAAHIGGLISGAVTGLIIFSSMKKNLSEESTW